MSLRLAGRVEAGQALLPITLRVSADQNVPVYFVVDTGFNGFLTLPPAAVAALKLPFVAHVPVSLADDSIALVAAHTVTVLWDGQAVPLRVLAMGKQPRVGTALLREGELLAQFVENGLVSLEEI